MNLISVENYLSESGGMILLIDRILDDSEIISKITENLKLDERFAPIFYNQLEKANDKIPVIIVPIDEYLICHLMELDYLKYPFVYYSYGMVQYTKYITYEYDIDKLIENIIIGYGHKHVIVTNENIEDKLKEYEIQYEKDMNTYIINQCNSVGTIFHFINPVTEQEISELLDGFNSIYKLVNIYYIDMTSKNMSLIFASKNDAMLSFISNIDSLDILYSIPGNLIKTFQTR